MTLIRRTSPLGEMLSLRHAMDRLFDEAFLRPVASGDEDAVAMPMDIYTTPEALVIEAALPGVRPEDVDVSLLGDTLTLTATSRSERTDQEGGYHVHEVRRGRFSRTVSLPSGLRTDAARAVFEHGILRLSVPKAEQARPRQIPVTAPAEGAASVVGPADAPQAASAGERPAAG